jgi:hypothetical protein
MDIIQYEEKKSKKKVAFLDEGIEFYGTMEQKPEIEQLLFKLQDEFYSAKTEEKRRYAWGEMLKHCQAYARSLYLKMNKGHKYVDPDIVTDRATYAALKFMSQYIDRPGFHCGASFAGLLRWKVVEAKSKGNEDNQFLSLNMLLSNDSTAELEDIQEKVGFESLFTDFQSPEEEFFDDRSLKTEVDEILAEFDSGLDDKSRIRERILIRAWFSILLKKPRNKHAKRCFLNQWCDYRMKKMIDLATLELKRRLTTGFKAIQ